jgi:hypothetical protein
MRSLAGVVVVMAWEAAVVVMGRMMTEAWAGVVEVGLGWG